jgi:hypothetical protein
MDISRRVIEANVPENVWVAAVQTGTIGFFHNKSCNWMAKSALRR